MALSRWGLGYVASGYWALRGGSGDDTPLAGVVLPLQRKGSSAPQQLRFVLDEIQKSRNVMRGGWPLQPPMPHWLQLAP